MLGRSNILFDGEEKSHDNTSLSLNSSSIKFTHQQSKTVAIQTFVQRLGDDSHLISDSLLTAYFARSKSIFHRICKWHA